MNEWIGIACFGVLLSAATASVVADTYQHDPKRAEEFREREGLPNFFRKADSQKAIKIAYFGGSITEANGWRVKTMSWFKSRFPNTQCLEINAAISGTGTGFAACRLSTDVLAHHPDLVFIEFRVNGGEGVGAQSVEGIVRQIWAANPETDICFIYTVREDWRNQIQAGTAPGFGQVMERIANHYGIPSIDLGIEVFR